MIELSKRSDMEKDIDGIFPDDIYRKALQQLEEASQDVIVVQVGSFDGISNDELYPFLFKNKHWRGLLIEPMFVPFQKLKENYENRENLIFVNKAIDDWIGESQIWTIPYEEKDNPELPPWATGCTTLRPYRNPLFGNNCTTEQFETLKKYTTVGFAHTTILPELLKEHEIEKIDVFHVDAEGADWDVIRQLNFDIYNPEIIYFEVFNITELEYGECVYVLEKFGYDLLRYRNNITAIKQGGLIDPHKIKEEINLNSESLNK